MVFSFRKYLYWSLGLHLACFFFFLISPTLPFFKASHFRKDKIVWVSLPQGVTNELGSPMKKAEDLPKTTIQEQKKAIESPPAGENKPSMTYEPPKSAEKKPGEPKSPIEEALAHIKNTAVKKVEPEAAQVPNAKPGGFTFGTATGTYVSPTDPEYVMYQAKIRQRIMTEWILPLKYTDANLGLVCKIVVHVNDRGELVQTEWEQRSDNPSFDASALRAIEKAAPLDVPPERLKWEVYNEGFTVEFKPQSSP